MTDLIFHVALEREWREAEGQGEYRRSTRGQWLHETGFIHCATLDQVPQVLASFYSDETDPLLLLTIDPEELEAQVRYETPEDEDQAFPHIYGALTVDAVVRTDPLPRDGEGEIALPDDL